jgi:hypothetical protein
MQQTQIRPMELGDILDGAFKIYRARFAPMFLSALLPFLPMMAATAILAGGVGSGLDGAVIAGGIAMLVSLPLMLIGFGFSYGSITHIVSETYQGRPAELADGMRRATSRFVPLTAGIVLSGMAVVLGLIFCIVPGIILGLMLFAVVPVVVIEGRGPIEALGRSRDLSNDALGPIFLVLFVAGLIAALPSYAVSAASYASAATGHGSPMIQIGSALIRLLLSAVTTPFSAAATTLLYFDRRIRTEAFDVQMAAEALGTEPGV